MDTRVDEGRRVWLPLLDGTERLGVMEMTFRGTEDELSAHALAVVERYAHFVAGVIVTKDAYSDVFKILRRRRELTTATELVREMVPPSVMATDSFVLRRCSSRPTTLAGTPMTTRSTTTSSTSGSSTASDTASPPQA